jgi:hypothetical protein
MISVRIPRFDLATATTYTVMISHYGHDYVHLREFAVPRLDSGEVDSEEIQRTQHAEFEYCYNNKDQVWPDRTPDPYEKATLAETMVVAAPGKEDEQPRAQSSSAAEVYPNTTEPPEGGVYPFRVGDPLGPPQD